MKQLQRNRLSGFDSTLFHANYVWKERGMYFGAWCPKKRDWISRSSLHLDSWSQISFPPPPSILYFFRSNDNNAIFFIAGCCGIPEFSSILLWLLGFPPTVVWSTFRFKIVCCCSIFKRLWSVVRCGNGLVWKLWQFFTLWAFFMEWRYWVPTIEQRLMQRFSSFWMLFISLALFVPIFYPSSLHSIIAKHETTLSASFFSHCDGDASFEWWCDTKTAASCICETPPKKCGAQIIQRLTTEGEH